MSYSARVLERTGHTLDAIPWGEMQDLLGGQIIARREDEAVVTYGYPDEYGEDPRWVHPTSYRRVSLVTEGAE